MTRERKPELGSPEFMAHLAEAIHDAIAEAVAELHRDGHPVYILDEDGAICQVYPDGQRRKISQSEIDALTDDPEAPPFEGAARGA